MASQNHGLIRKIKYVMIFWLATGLGVWPLAARAGTLQIDPGQSKIEVAVHSTIDSFVAHLDKYQANVACDPAVPLPAKADLSFDFADLKTGNPDRDAAMLKWLAYDQNPRGTFHLTGWSQAGTTNIASGQLTIHGVSVPVQMPATVTHDGTTWDISGQTTFDYRDFQLSKIRKLFVLTVDPRLTVTFHLSGQVKASQ